MNRKLFTFAALLILLSLLLSCSSGTDTDSETSQSIPSDTSASDNTAFNVSVLSGTTGYGIAPMYRKLKEESIEGLNCEISVYPEASLISSMLISGQTQFAAIPTNLASVIYNKSEGKIKILAVNTLGVLYVAENGNSISNLDGLSGKKIYVPGQGTNPEFILRILLEKAGLSDKVTLDYTYSSPLELMQAAAAGKADTVLLPEPMLTAACTKNSDIRIAVDISDEWKKQNGSELVQGCLVVRTDFSEEHPAIVDLFMKEYKTSCKTVSETPEDAANDIAYMGLSSDTSMTEKAIPRCNIVCVNGEQMKTDLTSYWKALFDLIPSSVGGKLPDEKIFN